MHVYVLVYIFMYRLIYELLISSMESLQQRNHSIQKYSIQKCSIQKCHGSSKGFALQSCKLPAQILPAHTPPWHPATIPVQRRSSPATSPGLVSPLLHCLLSHLILAFLNGNNTLPNTNAYYYSQPIKL